MNRTKIEWCQYTINPVQGKCPMGCSYCYMWGAHGIGIRFHFNPRLRYDPSQWLGLGSLKKPSRIFVGSTMELFHHRMNPKWLKWIMEVPLEFPQHTFIFLTKQPQNLPREFPENCWVGVTITENNTDAGSYLCNVKAKVKFISFEPLLKWGHYPPEILIEVFDRMGISWLIIGQQTPVSAKTEPKIEWVKEIVEAADKAGIPVFLKDNLKPLIDRYYPHESDLVPNHNKLVRMERPPYCPDCLGKRCNQCGVIWGLRQEMPK